MGLVSAFDKRRAGTISSLPPPPAVVTMLTLCEYKFVTSAPSYLLTRLYVHHA